MYLSDHHAILCMQADGIKISPHHQFMYNMIDESFKRIQNNYNYRLPAYFKEIYTTYILDGFDRCYI